MCRFGVLCFRFVLSVYNLGYLLFYLVFGSFFVMRWLACGVCVVSFY